MKQVSKTTGPMLVTILLITAIACNNNRSANNTGESTDSAAVVTEDAAAKAPTSGAFNQSLTFKQYSFTVNSEGEDTLRRLTIAGKDSTHDLDVVNAPFDGTIYYATTADLNNDGRPEVYCFARGADSAGYSKVYAYAYDQRKGTPISFPELKEGEAAGYMGQDSIYIENQYVVRTFMGRKSAGDTTGTRQSIRYMLKKGPSGYRMEQVK